MTHDPTGRSEEEAAEQKRQAERRRRLDRVFGDVLPDQTADEVHDPHDAGATERANDEWLRGQVPPHHG